MTPGLRELAPSGFVINFITARIPSLAPVVVAMRMMMMIVINFIKPAREALGPEGPAR